MMAVATKPMNAPIQPYLLPINLMKDPITPFRPYRPIPNSAIIRGMENKNRQQTQAIKKAPPPSSPPFCATMRGKRQIFPVPTAIPSTLRISPSLEEKKLALPFLEPFPSPLSELLALSLSDLIEIRFQWVYSFELLKIGAIYF